MSVWFTSDLHFHHQGICKHRGFDSMDEHDYTLVENINKAVNKRDKLYLLGDIVWSRGGLKWLANIQCQNIEMIYGNHDQIPATELLKYVQKLHGFRQYKNYWLSHCPIHPQELYRCKANIHGHIHKGAATDRILDDRYICVNPEFWNLSPVSFDYIEARL